MATALMAGASGLVGGHLLRRLLEDGHWERVLSVGRRTLSLSHARLEQQVIDFAAIEKLPPVDDVFCCLGTTIKKAGSQDAFRAVDHDAVLALARAARTAGAKQFLHVSALGASASSPVFYNRIKGQTEVDVSTVGFVRVVAFRPSVLDGERPEFRAAEQLGLKVMRALSPVLGKYAPTHADDVARAMIAEAKSGTAGVHVVESNEISRRR